MKKSKLSIGLVTSFIAAMALSACGSSVTKNDNNIVSFKGYGGEALSVLTDEIYKDYMESSTGLTKSYDQVMEVLIRHAFQKDPDGKSTLEGIKKSYNRIVNEARDDVKGAKQTAKQNAETNGTSYSKEWQSILTEKGVKDEEELLQYYIYKLEKEEIEDWYYNKHEEELKQEYLGVDAEGKEVKTDASSRYPYHVRHILIKVEDGGSDYVRGTISASQAKLLSTTVDLLAQNDMTFGEVAKLKSEDSSASSYGDVGIMSAAISSGKLGMVNEFQLGIYAYDAIKKNADTSTVVDEGLGLDKPAVKFGQQNVKQYFASRGIVEIPYSVFKELGDVAELEANYQTGLKVEDGKSAIYPRNLLWNNYLNNHAIFVITNGARPDAATSLVDINRTNLDPTTAFEDSYFPEADDYEDLDGNKTINYQNYNKKFVRVAGFENAEAEKVLCDERGNVIIGVRSQYGIHLMVVEKSAYEFAEYADEQKTQELVSLAEYYTTAIPGDDDYPTYKTDDPAQEPKYKKGDNKKTYVNFINTVNNSEYNTRADAVKSAIKSFDTTYDYRLYGALTADRSQFVTQDTLDLLDAIDNYIDVQQDKNKEDQSLGLAQVWQTYVELLKSQDYYRHNTKRVLSEGCKIAFTKGLTEAQKKEYEEEGFCYVK